MTQHADNPPLSADDPRISEWIDGRLPAAEAAEVKRAVEGSPKLAQLVADLRAIKAASQKITTTPPPAGFTDRVMDALAGSQWHNGGIAAGSDPAATLDTDRAVDEEWRAIEAERIATERAEAAVDVAETIAETKGAAGKPLRGWPWLAIAGSLAAGLVVAVVLNFSTDDQREVAFAPLEESGQDLDVSAKQSRAIEFEAAAGNVAAPGPATATDTSALPADIAIAAVADEAAPIVITVRGREGRAALDRLLVTSGLEVSFASNQFGRGLSLGGQKSDEHPPLDYEQGYAKAEERLDAKAADKPPSAAARAPTQAQLPADRRGADATPESADSLADSLRGRQQGGGNAGRPVSEVLELVGTAESIAAFLAAAGAATEGGITKPRSRADGQAGVTVRVRVVVEEAAVEPASEPQREGP
jgi:hypothetical protein